MDIDFTWVCPFLLGYWCGCVLTLGSRVQVSVVPHVGVCVFWGRFNVYSIVVFILFFINKKKLHLLQALFLPASVSSWCCSRRWRPILPEPSRLLPEPVLLQGAEGHVVDEDIPRLRAPLRARIHVETKTAVLGEGKRWPKMGCAAAFGGVKICFCEQGHAIGVPVACMEPLAQRSPTVLRVG